MLSNNGTLPCTGITRRRTKADALWDDHKLLVRCSHRVRDEVMKTRKQRVKYGSICPVTTHVPNFSFRAWAIARFRR